MQAKVLIIVQNAKCLKSLLFINRCKQYGSAKKTKKLTQKLILKNKDIVHQKMN
jgi:hypothetical protein